jgi:hypothetical protein
MLEKPSRGNCMTVDVIRSRSRSPADGSIDEGGSVHWWISSGEEVAPSLDQRSDALLLSFPTMSPGR